MIGPFRGEFAFLSNMYLSPFVTPKGTYCRTVEHAFQACKTLKEEEQRAVLNADRPGEAKRMGRKVTLRPNWNNIRLEVMYGLVRMKFEQNPDLLEKLLSTGVEKLEEVNTWNDRFWGTCRGVGENHLGKILMRVRTELGR